MVVRIAVAAVKIVGRARITVTQACEIYLTYKNACVIMNERYDFRRITDMKHIKTLNTKNLCDSAKNGGCGECQTSCQSACKTSCGIANQECENKETK